MKCSTLSFLGPHIGPHTPFDLQRGSPFHFQLPIQDRPQSDALFSSKSSQSSRSSERGFSISEVIIALLLVSLGALFLLRLGQANAALRSDLLQRHEAVRLATELAAWSLQGGSASLSLATVQQALNLSKPAPSVASCFDERCNASQAAENFLQEWRYKLQTALPEARLRICTEAPSAAAQPLTWACLSSPSVSTQTVLKLGRQPGFGVAERPFAVVALGSFA